MKRNRYLNLVDMLKQFLPRGISDNAINEMFTLDAVRCVEKDIEQLEFEVETWKTATEFVTRQADLYIDWLTLRDSEGT